MWELVDLVLDLNVSEGGWIRVSVFSTYLPTSKYLYHSRQLSLSLSLSMFHTTRQAVVHTRAMSLSHSHRDTQKLSHTLTVIQSLPLSLSLPIIHTQDECAFTPLLSLSLFLMNGVSTLLPVLKVVHRRTAKQQSFCVQSFHQSGAFCQIKRPCRRGAKRSDLRVLCERSELPFRHTELSYTDSLREEKTLS